MLGYMLANSTNSLINDAVVARVRGMLNDLAGQLLRTLPMADGETWPQPKDRGDCLESLADQIAADVHLLTYLHAIAVEGHLTDRLSQKSAIDPVLSALWQELVASDDDETAEIAMEALASQSRFIQSQRRMQYPITELPPDLLERVLRIWTRITPVERDAEVTEAMLDLKSDYDEASTRTGRLLRLISAMRGGAIAALELEHAGLALFTSALSVLTEQTREEAVIACHECQGPRLILGLRAVGLDGAAIARQSALLEPAERLLHGISDLSADSARKLLRQSDGSSTPRAVQ